MLVLNGLGLEASLERTLAAAVQPRLLRIESAAAVAPCPPPPATITAAMPMGPPPKR